MGIDGAGGEERKRDGVKGPEGSMKETNELGWSRKLASEKGGNERARKGTREKEWDREAVWSAQGKQAGRSLGRMMESS